MLEIPVRAGERLGGLLACLDSSRFVTRDNSSKDVFYWHDLTCDERRALRYREDEPIVSVIDGISEVDRWAIYQSIKPKVSSMNHYNTEQKKWLDDEAWWLGERVNHNPDPTGELGLDILDSGLSERFRLYFAAKFPKEVDVYITFRTIKFLYSIRNALKKAALDKAA